jgi:hypothetical protein
MAEETGGRAFFTSSVIDLEKTSPQSPRLRSQYLIAYAPSMKSRTTSFARLVSSGYKDFRIGQEGTIRRFRVRSAPASRRRGRRGEV